MKPTAGAIFDVRTQDAASRGARGRLSFAPDLYWWIVTGARTGPDAPAGGAPPLDTHPFHEIICAVSGAGIVQVGTTRLEAAPGDVFVVNPGERHRDYPCGERGFCVQYLAFACAARWAGLVGRELGRNGFPSRVDGVVAELYVLMEALQPELAEPRAFRESIVSAQLDVFLLKLLRAAAAGAPRRAPAGDRQGDAIGRRVADIVTAPPRARVSVGAMAQRCFLSRSYFSRVFKKETGQSPARFVLRRRMREAEALLADSADTVVSIAHRLGFEDEFYFSKVFKRLVGASPSAYRTQHRPA